jgi:diadenosine tetraphosphatase ApaH/serine/threonine PP2A family protein phosphatase
VGEPYSSCYPGRFAVEFGRILRWIAIVQSFINDGALSVRALLLSDIHANIDALEAVLAAAPPHDVVWNLGDIVGYGGAPNEVIERVQALGETFVRGNHDRACCGQLSLEEFNPIAGRAVRWTQEVLTPEHTQWLQQMAAGPVTPDGPQVSCMHGSYFDEDEYMFSLRDAWLPLRQARTRINFFGHTHVQGGFASNGEDWFELKPQYTDEEGFDSSELVLRSSVRYLINPGSVGQPRDGDWRAACAVYDDAEMSVQFLRVPYDYRLAQMRFQRAGLPDRLAFRLREGR